MITALIALCLLGGLAAITYGAALIYLPAGIITGGCCLILAAFVLALGAEDRQNKP